VPKQPRARVVSPEMDSAEADAGVLIGPLLASTRKKKKWTLSQLANASGVAIGTLSKIENGKSGASFDTVVIHQVLHYADRPAEAIQEAARVLRPGGRLVIVDFAPHELEFLRDQHAHRKLGFAPETIAQWIDGSGLDVIAQRTLAPGSGSPAGIAVSLWLGRDRRMAVAETSALEVV